MDKSIKKTGKLFGVLLGVCLALLILIAYFANLDLLVNSWYGLSIYVLAIIFGIIAVIKTKVDLKGIISFKKTFSVYFLTILIGLLIVTSLSYILFNFIDTESGMIVNEMKIEKYIEGMKAMGKSETEINAFVENSKSTSSNTILDVLTGMIMIQLLPLSIIGLLVSTALKKNDTDTK